MRLVSFRGKLFLIFLYCVFVLFLCLQYLRGVTGPVLNKLEKLQLYRRVEEYKKGFCVEPNVFDIRRKSSWDASSLLGWGAVESVIGKKFVDQKEEEEEINRVTLVLHISGDYLDERIVEQVENWNGPVSLAVYVSQPDEQIPCLSRMLHNLAESHAIHRLRVHFFYKADSCGLSVARIEEVDDVFCSIGDSRNKTIQDIADYPANVARNIARKFTRSRYILIADFEHLFSEGFEKRMVELSNREIRADNRTVLVYRIFEISDDLQSNPKTKADLAVLLANGSAVVFHEKFYHGAHAIPGLKEWLAKEEGSGDGISKRMLNFSRADWEPQFVSSASIPLHDENFPYMIRDNTCLRWELCRAGYEIAIVDDHYMFHRGIKTAGAIGKTKKIQDKNRKRFHAAMRAFKERMDKQYPNTKTKCPSIGA